MSEDSLQLSNRWRCPTCKQKVNEEIGKRCKACKRKQATQPPVAEDAAGSTNLSEFNL